LDQIAANRRVIDAHGLIVLQLIRQFAVGGDGLAERHLLDAKPRQLAEAQAALAGGSPSVA